MCDLAEFRNIQHAAQPCATNSVGCTLFERCRILPLPERDLIQQPAELFKKTPGVTLSALNQRTKLLTLIR